MPPIGAIGARSSMVADHNMDQQTVEHGPGQHGADDDLVRQTVEHGAGPRERSLDWLAKHGIDAAASRVFLGLGEDQQEVLRRMGGFGRRYSPEASRMLMGRIHKTFGHVGLPGCVASHWAQRGVWTFLPENRFEDPEPSETSDAEVDVEAMAEAAAEDLLYLQDLAKK